MNSHSVSIWGPNIPFRSLVESINRSVSRSFSQSIVQWCVQSPHQFFTMHCALPLRFSFVPPLVFLRFFAFSRVFFCCLSSHNQLPSNVTLFYLLSASVSFYLSPHFFYIFRNIFEQQLFCCWCCLNCCCCCCCWAAISNAIYVALSLRFTFTRQSVGTWHK